MRLQYLSRTLPAPRSRKNFPSQHYLSTVAVARHPEHPPSTPVPDPIRGFDIHASLLRLCLRECRQFTSHHLFDEMLQRAARGLTICKLIHGQGVKCGIGSKGSLGNAILDLYAKCGDVDSAEKAFNRLEGRDILAWNSLLSMYSRRVSVQLVKWHFRLLKRNGLVPNEFSYSIVFSACARATDIDFGKQVHCDLVKVGLELSSFCEGSIIDMYARCDRLVDARQIFDGVLEPDTVSWTAMIAGYIRGNLPEEALNVFEKVKKAGREPDQVAFVTVISAYVGAGNLEGGRELFSQMPNPNVVAWNVMISGHAQRGYEVEALHFFEQMRRAGIKSTRSTLGSILSAIGALGAIECGLLVHAEAIKQGLSSNVYVGSSLISMYAKCGRMEAAMNVFDALEEKNVVLWNAMLGGFAQNGYASEVVQLFTQMKRYGFQPDEYTYTSILSACACLEYVEVGRQLHCTIIKNRLASNLFVGNALVDMYAKSGDLDESRKQFECLKSRDKVSWNAIIVGYVQGEEENEAFRMFQQMNLTGIVADEAAVASILSACANIQALDQGKQVHCLAVKSGLETSLYAGSSLIDMYAKCGDIGAALIILSHMPERSVASMNAMIAGYAKDNLDQAINMLGEIHDMGMNPNEITYSSILDACNGVQGFILGAQIHCRVLKSGIWYYEDFLGISLLCMYMNSESTSDACILFSEFPNPKSAVLWTALISGYTKNDCNGEALKAFREMRKHNAPPDQATFVSILKACSILSSLRDGRQVHPLMFHSGFDLDELSSVALVDMYAKCGDVKSSVQVFNEMTSKTGVISWNSMIVGFAKNGFAENALQTYNAMKQSNVVPDDITFLGVLTACSHAGMVVEGRNIYDEMVNRYRIQPRVDHNACMVDLLGRWGFLEEAVAFIDKLNSEPDAMIWTTLLGACRLHGDEIRGKLAAEKLIESEPQNSAPYVLLSNIHAASGNWQEVNQLRRQMKEKGVKKLPGCSWITVGNKTNLFVAGDESLPRAGEVRALLKNLTSIIKKDSYIKAENLLYGV
ncbi:pentatricopeptide repeat-containing protein At3g09040, mitochondrial isoform X2 [Eucalyptus grandis]|uniref:pentatricopeptide repeat-containing protein At3g09040, mitochondrial isoform X1 n=1 Tax=Eucalyptus grandis TaxID=71139 RepID=UPI00192ED8DB|nr:pentatricopeptide repeat-containing protein At3g09040, mitochondrial isoform X1 [Eucalyptus grandis]XP_039170829.1 pentatricopeptide repeat-containing protein At3g09040, mitochondrial isoform X2 [Eucalyptus grandis]XP_039170830.1 pentatricopeptide repeat-containing protein At3g09040, mitochondrial isoform X1 [Eucalyptus grandis]XP_039170831.1 pentatricopeptide repeat-containing protein At3g09040, mitochondrial isoform X1 [Eucalyptus grandis]XP_039170832.1 pentatricopeptide repeat-containing 